jgi:hypothetical protein
MTLGVALLNNFDPGSGMICFCRTNASTYVLRQCDLMACAQPC